MRAGEVAYVREFPLSHAPIGIVAASGARELAQFYIIPSRHLFDRASQAILQGKRNQAHS